MKHARVVIVPCPFLQESPPRRRLGGGGGDEIPDAPANVPGPRAPRTCLSSALFGDRDIALTSPGVIASLLGAIWLPAVIGLEYPLGMLPLLSEISWKSIRMIACGLPQ